MSVQTTRLPRKTQDRGTELAGCGQISNKRTSARAVLRKFAVCLVTVLALAGGGCAEVGPRQQRLVSKADMVFSASAFMGYENPLLEQVEPGAAFCAGAQSGGCTSCK
jgi:hypothetical protein